VYREVKIIKETAAASKKKPSDAVAVVSYDEKPGIQAIATTGPDLPPEPGVLDRGAAASQVSTDYAGNACSALGRSSRSTRACPQLSRMIAATN
jgi:hypothetical protein